MQKMTYAIAIDNAINAIAGMDNMAETVEKLEALKAQLAKRNAGERKPTKTQVANEGVKAEILAFLANGEKHTATEIMTAVGIESNQKATALLRQLKEAELITREEIKRKAYFAIA